MKSSMETKTVAPDEKNIYIGLHISFPYVLFLLDCLLLYFYYLFGLFFFYFGGIKKK